MDLVAQGAGVGGGSYVRGASGLDDVGGGGMSARSRAGPSVKRSRSVRLPGALEEVRWLNHHD